MSRIVSCVAGLRSSLLRRVWYVYGMIRILATLYFGLNIAIAVVIVRKYLRTRDIGFVWLGAALIIWPLSANLLNVFRQVLIDRFVRQYGDAHSDAVITAFSAGKELIGAALLLVAVLCLHRMSTRSAVSS